MDVGTLSNGSPIGPTSPLQDQTPSSPCCTPAETRGISRQILDIILEHALNKFDDSEDRLAAGVSEFLSTIDYFVTAGRRVEACLPAFPFKSANKVYKVLGSLPDKAEELALERLNTMCTRIQKIYRPGARITIISDGITYNGNATTVIPGYSHMLTSLLRSIVNIRS